MPWERCRPHLLGRRVCQGPGAAGQGQLRLCREAVPGAALDQSSRTRLSACESYHLPNQPCDLDWVSYCLFLPQFTQMKIGIRKVCLSLGFWRTLRAVTHTEHALSEGAGSRGRRRLRPRSGGAVAGLISSPVRASIFSAVPWGDWSTSSVSPGSEVSGHCSNGWIWGSRAKPPWAHTPAHLPQVCGLRQRAQIVRPQLPPLEK